MCLHSADASALQGISIALKTALLSSQSLSLSHTLFRSLAFFPCAEVRRPLRCFLRFCLSPLFNDLFRLLASFLQAAVQERTLSLFRNGSLLHTLRFPSRFRLQPRKTGTHVGAALCRFALTLSPPARAEKRGRKRENTEKGRELGQLRSINSRWEAPSSRCVFFINRSTGALRARLQGMPVGQWAAMSIVC